MGFQGCEYFEADQRGGYWELRMCETSAMAMTQLFAQVEEALRQGQKGEALRVLVDTSATGQALPLDQAAHGRIRDILIRTDDQPLWLAVVDARGAAAALNVPITRVVDGKLKIAAKGFTEDERAAAAAWVTGSTTP